MFSAMVDGAMDGAMGAVSAMVDGAMGVVSAMVDGAMDGVMAAVLFISVSGNLFEGCVIHAPYSYT